MIVMNVVKSPRSKFVHVMCKKCKSEQVIYNKAVNTITCNKCQAKMAEPTGGEIRVSAKVLEILG